MDRFRNDSRQTQYPTYSSSYFGHAHDDDDPGPEQDYALDAFDRQILSRQADQRPLLPEQFPFECSAAFTSKPAVELDDGWKSLRDDLHDVRQAPHSSSSPTFPVSSPTVLALQNRNNASQRSSQLPRRTFKNATSGSHSLHTQARNTQQMLSASSSNPFKLPDAPPTLRGVPMVSTDQLPDQMRSIFPFDLFNIVQSKCFPDAFNTDDNLVVAAPTGSGKTAIMELAICRLLTTNKNHDFKVVYQAPTKSLCSERFRDWNSKFSTLGLQCGELTGDVEFAHSKTVQQAHIIITTPEKWDSVSRKWKDNAKLMQMIKLFLVDEVHILNETRGATLEAVVSRMKSAGSGVRFVALSATVPNSDDIATWLGRSSALQHLPASRAVFDETYRPVKLEKHVVGFKCSPNDFALDSILNKEIPKVIAQHAKRKPVMVFCVSKRSAMKSATSLAELWHATTSHLRLWSGPRRKLNVTDAELQKIIPSGVAFHHGGLESEDRKTIEQGFLRGDVNIICSTSTLAVGINLPCYLVILKGTSGWNDSGLHEYSSLEVMQMLGRAGRPQFEQSACAVILTHATKTQRYEQMVSGQEVLESSLHENLIEHLNAEIGIGTIHDVQSAKKWLLSSFLSVRLRRNPQHYHLQDGTGRCDPDQLLEQICERDLKLLETAQLIHQRNGLQCTSYGDAMARYYVKYETMLAFLKMPKAARISDVLNTLVQAHEFRDLKLRSGEKSMLKEINTGSEIRYPIKGEIGLAAHKASLLVQAQLGGVVLDKPGFKSTAQFRQDTIMVMNHCNRLVRCLIDMQIHNEDSVAVKHALELCRSVAAGVWDNTPMQLKQIDSIGDVTARKLAAGGINSIDTLLSTEPQQIELVLGKSQPFGSTLLKKAAGFPNLRVSVKETNQVRKRQSQAVEVRLQCEVGFLNNALPAYFNRKAVYICFLCETSYGKLLDFRRFSATRLRNGEQIHLTALLDRRSDYIRCHIMCDEIAGTHRYAELKLNIPDMWFPCPEPLQESRLTIPTGALAFSNDSERFDDAGIADDDLLAVANGIEVVDMTGKHVDKPRNSLNVSGYDQNILKRKATGEEQTKQSNSAKGFREPTQLPNGNWTCQHTCAKENKECKHVCCKEGVKKPKKRAKVQAEDGINPSLGTSGSLNIDQAKPNHVAAQHGGQFQDKANKCRKITDLLVPRVSAHSQPEPTADNFVFDIDDLTSDDLPSVKTIIRHPEQDKLNSDVRSDPENAIESYDGFLDFDDMNFDLDECDWILSAEKLADANPEVLEKPQHASYKAVSKHTSPDHCRPLMEESDPMGRQEEPQAPTAPSDTALADVSINHEPDFLDSTAHSDFVAFDQADDFNAESVLPNHSSGDKLSIPIHTNDQIAAHADSTLNQGATPSETDVERKQKLHDEDQKKKWAQFPPWMYEMFGSCVEIVDN